MENLDEFMRHKMQTDTPGDPFPFREEHWEHALKLLEAEDQRKKRRRAIFWWWLFGVLLLPSAGTLAWWLEPAAQTPIAAENTASGAKEAPEITSERHLTNAEKNTSAATPAQTQTGVEKTIAGANNIPTSINAKSSDHIRKSGATVLSENTQTRKPENTSSALENTKTQKHQNTSISALENTKTLNLENTSTTAPENTQTPKHQNTSISLENTKTLKPQNTSLALLAPAETTLRYDRPLTMQSVQVPPAPIKPVQEARWSFGVNIEGAAQPLSPGPRYLGYAGGGYARYRISEKWQLGAGIAVRQMAINFKDGVAANSSNQLKYSFGYTQETLKDSSLNHYALEIPLGVQRRFGRFGVEAGIAPGMLLGLGATRFTSTQSSLSADPKTTETKVWLGKNAAYKKFWVAPMLALDYRLNKRLALNLNAVYRPGGVLPRDVEFYEQAGTDLSIGLGLRLNLFTVK
jgi:hypothetical protein